MIKIRIVAVAAIVAVLAAMAWQLSRVTDQRDEARTEIVVRDGALRQAHDALDTQRRQKQAAERVAVEFRKAEQRRRAELSHAQREIVRLGAQSNEEYRNCRPIPVPAAVIDRLQQYAGDRDADGVRHAPRAVPDTHTNP